MLSKGKKSIVSIMVITMLITIFTMVFSLNGCAVPAATEGEKEPVKIGLVTWSEGTTLTAGRAYTRAFKSGISYINNQGGILDGRMAEGIIAPQGITSETAKNAALRLVMTDGVTALIGPHWGSYAPAGLEVAQKYKIPFLPLQGGTWLYEQKYIGTVGFEANAFGRANAEAKWAEGKGYKKVVWLGIDMPYNDDVINTIKLRWTSADFPELIDVIKYDFNAVDIKTEVTKAVGLKPDLIWCEEWSDTSATFILKQINELGYKGDVVLSSEIKNQTIIDLPREITEGVYVFKEWVPDATVPENKAFTDYMTKEWGEVPDCDEQIIWSATVFVLLAMDKAGVVPDGSEEAINKVGEAMHSLGWTGPMGIPTKLDESGLVLRDKLAMAVIKDGVFVLDKYIEMTNSEWLPWLK